MILSFRHKGIERFFLTGSLAGIQAKHAARLAQQLAVLDEATGPEAMLQIQAWKGHALRGALRGFWAVSLSGSWRLTYKFEDGNALLVDYQDDH